MSHRIRSLRIALAVAVVGSAWLLGSPQAAVRAPVGSARAAAIYGYPWATHCPAAGVADVIDRWAMYACNCTSYVAWALDANHQRIDWFVAGAMNAWNWPHVARLSGLETGTRPRVGAVAVWPKLSLPFGHLGYVVAVHPDGRFEVAEYNLGPLDGYSPYTFDLRDNVAPAGAEFIYVPRRP